MKVLLVEDDLDQAISIEEYLETEGIAVSHYLDFAGAKASLSNGTYDLIICDLELGEASAADEVPNLIDKYQIPLIMISGVSGTSDRIELLNLGACDFLQKPFDPAELVARIRANLRIQSRPNVEKGAIWILSLIHI